MPCLPRAHSPAISTAQLTYIQSPSATTTTITTTTTTPAPTPTPPTPSTPPSLFACSYIRLSCVEKKLWKLPVGKVITFVSLCMGKSLSSTPHKAVLTSLVSGAIPPISSTLHRRYEPAMTSLSSRSSLLNATREPSPTTESRRVVSV